MCENLALKPMYNIFHGLVSHLLLQKTLEDLTEIFALRRTNFWLKNQAKRILSWNYGQKM